MDVSQRRELTDGLTNRAHGSFELVFAPLLFGLLGFVIDRAVGIVPVLTVSFTILGLVGVVAKIYYGYREAMK